MQIDLPHAKDAEQDDDPRLPIDDELVASLPERDGKPLKGANCRVAP